MFSEGNAAHPVGCDSPLLTIMALSSASNLKKNLLNAITICRGLSHPTRSLSRIVCRGLEDPKGSKRTLRPDFQINTRHRIFLKPMSPQDKRKGPFRFFSKICGDIRGSRCTTGVVDTGGKRKKSSSRKILIILYGHLCVVELTYK